MSNKQGKMAAELLTSGLEINVGTRARAGSAASRRAAAAWMIALSGLALTSAESASAGSLSEDGQLRLTVNVRGIPTPEDLNQVEEQIRMAQLALCNATDGRIRLTSVFITPRPASELRSDVWWYPQAGRENASVGGLETDTGRVLWFGTFNPIPLNGQEFWKFQERPSPSSGPSFGLDGGTLGHELVHYVLGMGDEYPEQNKRLTGCGQGPGIEGAVFDEFNNSLAQVPRQSCVNQLDQTHEDFDPVLVSVPCLTDEDCAPFDDATFTWTCQQHPHGRELSVDANFDTVLSPWRYGGAISACPAPRAPTDLHLHARIRITDVEPISLEEYAEGGPVVANVNLNSGSIKPVPIFDESGGQDAIHDLLVSLVKYQTEPTAKVMVIFSGPKDEYLAAPTVPEAVVGDHPALFEIARFALDYDAAGNPIAVNGISMDANGLPQSGSYPEIQLGGLFAPGGFGNETDGAMGQTVSTSAFQTGAPAVTLRLHLENLRNQDYASQTPSSAVGSGLSDLGNSAFILSDARLGLVGTRAESDGLAPQLACSNADYCLLYNPETGRYDGSSHTLVQLFFEAQAQGVALSDIVLQKQAITPVGERVPMRSGWGSFFDRYGSFVGKTNGLTSLQAFIAEPGVVDPARREFVDCGPPDCGTPELPCETAVTFDNPEVPDQFVIVIDKSGSMRTPLGVGTGASVADTRLDFAKAAASSVVDAFASSSTADGTEIGVVAFDETATVVSAIGTETNPLREQLQLIAADDGFTAIAAGMDTALTSLQLTPETGAKAVLLLSDGENNRPCDCVPAVAAAAAGCPPPNSASCNTDQLPAAAAARLAAANVRLYTVPMGQGADRTAYAELANVAGGESFDSVDETEVIPNFMLAYIAFRGGQPLLAKADSFVQQRPPRIPKARQTRTEEAFPLAVETGATELKVLLSVRSSDPAYWAPNYELRNPAGDIVATEQGVVVGSGLVRSASRFYHLLTVPSPSAGEWQLRMLAPVAGTTRSFITAYVENPGPDCFVDTLPGPLVQEGQTVRVHASASLALPLESGASFSGELRRPDGTRVPVSFEPSPVDPDQFQATLVPAALNGTGTYSVEVTCLVQSGAKPVQGEGENDPPNTLPVDGPFERTGRAQFFLQSSSFPVTTVTDTDRDGIRDVDEPSGDLDEDGLPNDRDSDADGDELVDGLDPMPFDPSAPSGSCSALPSDVGCCSNLAQCGGRDGYVLYALDKLHMADRVAVDTAATVASRGTEMTQLGVDAHCGDILSAPSVQLQNYSDVEGDLYTGGTLDPQLGAVVSGGVTLNATLSLPDFRNFWIDFPEVPLGNEAPELGLEDNLEPGRYGQVIAEPGSVLRLFSGSYFIDDFHVEPQAVIEMDASQGPIFLYVAGRFTFRGQQLGVVGPEVLVGYFGTETVAIERAFKGTIVAPNATVNLGPANEGTRLDGAIFAARIFVQPDVIVHHVPFFLPWAAGAQGLSLLSPCLNNSQDAGETAVDCGGPLCSPCDDGMSCGINADCLSGACQSGECGTPPTNTLGLVFDVSSDWGAGYCGALRVINSGSSAVSGWNATLNLGAAVLTTQWNASAQSNTGVVSMTSSQWTGSVPAGGSNSQAGLCAQRPSGGAQLPTLVSITAQP